MIGDNKRQKKNGDWRSGLVTTDEEYPCEQPDKLVVSIERHLKAAKPKNLGIPRNCCRIGRKQHWRVAIKPISPPLAHRNDWIPVRHGYTGTRSLHCPGLQVANMKDMGPIAGVLNTRVRLCIGIWKGTKMLAPEIHQTNGLLKSCVPNRIKKRCTLFDTLC